MIYDSKTKTQNNMYRIIGNILCSF